MFYSLLRRWLVANREQAVIQQSRRSRRRQSALPTVEALEDRLTPSAVLTVVNSTDHDPGSLRAAVASAGSGDTIKFANSVHLIKLTSGEIEIGKNLNIIGPGPQKLTVSGNDASRVFHIDAGKTVNISNLTVAHGKSTGQLPTSMVGEFLPGGGSGAGGGGGILNEAGAHLTLNSDSFSSNQAVGAEGFTVVGGALMNLGTATVLSCDFSNNQATGGGASDALGGSSGGAIENFGSPAGPASLTVVSSTFSNNTAYATGGGYYFGIGGAVGNDAGLNGYDPGLAQPSTATLTNCSITDNLATGGPNVIGNGGGANTGGVGTVMTLIGCNVAGNRSVGGGGGDGLTTGDSEGIGGGLMNVFGTLNVIGCSITNNKALGGDNGIQSDANSFAGGAFGGGIQNNAGGTLNISNSLVCGNLAQAGNTTAGPGGCAIGGGIQNGGLASGPIAMNMTNCIVSNNSAVAGHGGPGDAGVTNLSGFAFGGGIDVSRGAVATIIGSLIAGNRAVGGAGGAGNNGGNAYGGGLSVGFANLAFGQPDGASLTLINSVVTGNQAVGGVGGSHADGGDGLGGGIYVGPTASADITHSLITLNQATGGHKGSGPGTSNGHGIGGGVYSDGIFTDDLLTILAGNFASTSNNNIFL
ncbi:MAG TPA: hypothetical protein VE988_24350 [Gemmataceae bacterium]|nr:hypothetical protein [Gemmataceae bacterium]